VVFEFLEPIAPGMERSKLISKLEQVVEERSELLMGEARVKAPQRFRWAMTLGLIAIILIGLYIAAWFAVKDFVQTAYLDLPAPYVMDYKRNVRQVGVSGFPFSFDLQSEGDETALAAGSLMLESLSVQTTALPLPFNPVHARAYGITVQGQGVRERLEFQTFGATAVYDLKNIHITDGVFQHALFAGSFEGVVNPHQDPPEIDIIVRTKDHIALVDMLVERGLIRKRMKVWIMAGLGAFTRGEFVEIPVQQKQGIVYAGPFPIYNLNDARTGNRDYSQPIRRRPVLPAPVSP